MGPGPERHVKAILAGAKMKQNFLLGVEGFGELINVYELCGDADGVVVVAFIRQRRSLPIIVSRR